MQIFSVAFCCFQSFSSTISSSPENLESHNHRVWWGSVTLSSRDEPSWVDQYNFNPCAHRIYPMMTKQNGTQSQANQLSHSLGLLGWLKSELAP